MQHGGYRRAVASALAIVGLASLPGLPVQARSISTPPSLARAQYGRLDRAHAGAVNIRQLAQQPRTAHPRIAAPAILRHPKAASSAPAPLALPSPPQGTTEEQLTVFQGMDVATASGTFSDQNIEPPDTQVAAGPTSVVEMVNANMSIWSKSGAQLAPLVDLNAFYGIPGGYGISDPRVVYDASSSRFLASAFALNANNDSNVYLAVSNTSDPTGTWFHWLVRNTAATITDQPKVGYSDDKVTMSWGEFVAPPCQGQSTFYCFNGQVTLVVQKSDVLAVPQNLSPRFAVLGPDLSEFGIVPAQSLSSTSAQYEVYNNADPYNLVENQCAQQVNALYGPCPTLGMVVITGTPAGSNLSMGEVDPPMADTTLPPNAFQPGTAARLQTGDDRLLNAVWRNNMIWTSLTDGNLCSTVRPMTEPAGSCARVIEASTTSFTLQQVLQLGSSGDYFFYPAVSPDSFG
ncbi:MAG: hypothetical protein E6I84_03125, partial [Chloroflexi bacterium]